MKLLVIGHARHGKDTVCEILRDHYGFSFTSSSDFCNEHVIFPVLSELYGYKTLVECYADRVNHREEWYRLICEYNHPDQARLAREILRNSDIYCGMRSADEFHASRKYFDYVVYVDASKRVEPEPVSSMQLEKQHADCIIDNNGSMPNLHSNVHDLVMAITTTNNYMARVFGV